MSNFKLVKTAAALALGASVVTSAVATTDASAASKYKIKSGKLVYAKSGKVVKGYVTYKSTVYKNGSKLTGLKGKTYYKAGKKATGTYKGAYYVKGVKKVTTGTYNKAYYVKGVKKVSTGLYASKYYKDGKLATGTYKGAYYVKGLKKVTTGTYNGAYYVAGKKVVSTGLYKDQLYVSGKLNKGYKLYKEDLYKDAVLNKGLVVFEGKLYDGAKQNDKLVIFDGKLYDGVKLNEGIKKFEDKWYNNAELADGTFTIDGKEVAFENGVEVGAKVKSVEAINGTQVKVTFNKSVDKDTVINSGTVIAANAKFTKVSDNSAATVSRAEVKGNVVIYTLSAVASGDYTVAINNLKTTGKEEIASFAKVVSFEADKVAPTVVKSEKINNKTVKVTFSEPVKDAGTWSYMDKDGNKVDVTSPTLTDNDTAVLLTLTDSDMTKVTIGSTITFTGVNIMDAAKNLISPNPAKVDFKIEAADAVAPKVTSINQTGAKKFEVTFDKPAKAGTVTVGGASTILAPKTEGASSDTTYVVETTNVLENPQTVVVSGFKNIDGTAMTSYSQVVSFIKDATVPTATADSKLVVVNGTQYIKLTFNTEVTAGQVTLNGSYVKDYLTTSVTETATAIYPDGDKSKKVLLVPVTDEDLTKEDAVYDLTVTSTAVKSLSDVTMASAKVSYTYKNVVVTNDHVFVADDITVAKVNDKPSEVTVTFGGVDKTLDRPTAVNASNYKVNGQAVKSAELTSASTVKLTLYPGQITVNGDYNVAISGVKVKDSTKVMDTVVKTTALVENVTPTVTKTILTSNGTAEVAAKATITGENASKVEAGATTSATTTAATGYKVVDNSGTLELQKASDSSVVIADLSSVQKFTQGGIEFTITGAAAGDLFTVATTAKVEAVKPTITVTASKDLKTTTAVNAFDVYVGTEKLTGSVTSSATGKVITIELPAPLTTAQLNAGLTVKLAEGKSVTDTNGNVLDIPTAGLKVTN
ncbi:MAG TPA: hypothetical protein VEZ91_06745 [Kurthia gibsonii]|nr:hypothetical protein [Kurthia gibsonii]